MLKSASIVPVKSGEATLCPWARKPSDHNILRHPQGWPYFGHQFDAIPRHIFRETARLHLLSCLNVALRIERRQKLGKIVATRPNWRDSFKKWTRQSIGAMQAEGGKAVVSQMVGAFVRACLVVFLIAAPSALLPDVSPEGKQMVALVALFAGLLTFIEYNATYPGLVEFRNAPPFNRIRFGMLFGMVFTLSLLERGVSSPSTLTDLVTAIGTLIGIAMDFPYSPVRLVMLTMAEGATPAQLSLIRSAAGLTYLLSLISLAVFMIVLKAGGWPKRGGAFNVWINLPTFDPTGGGDVVDRLNRDARVNIALGFLLPFLIPAVVKMGLDNMAHLPSSSPQTLVWTMTAWAFLPASLFMRGIAMGRIADMIRDKRRQNNPGNGGFAPV